MCIDDDSSNIWDFPTPTALQAQRDFILLANSAENNKACKPGRL